MPESEASAPDRPVPLWGWLLAVPCAAAAALAIDRGATLFTAAAPTETPFADGLLAMLAVVVASGSAFCCAILARSARPLWARLGGCAALLAATALCFRLAAPLEPGLSWRAVWTPSGRVRGEFPGPALFTEREAPGPQGTALLREASVRAGGLVFRIAESEGQGSDPTALIARARAGLLAGGALLLAEERLPGGIALTLRTDGRRFRARLLAAPPLVMVASAGPEGVDDAAIERFLHSLALEPPAR